MLPKLRKMFNGRSKSGIAYYYTVQYLLSPHFLLRNIKIKINRTINLPIILFEFETLSLTLREDHRLMVFMKRVLQKILGAKREEVTRDWSQLHNENFIIFTSLKSIQVINSRRMSWTGHVTCMKEKTGAPTVLVGEPKE
jgi:hypothetical protein